MRVNTDTYEASLDHEAGQNGQLAKSLTEPQQLHRIVHLTVADNLINKLC